MNILNVKTKPSALDFTESDWKQWLKNKGAKPFVAKQILQWIYKHYILNPQKFSNLSQTLRNSLEEEFNWKLPKIDTLLSSVDGSFKFLLKTHDHYFIESVLMPTEKRTTLCISSQVGCKMGCTFCQTGKMGFSRNLTTGEILCQLMIANQHLTSIEHERLVSNVVFMGMGEPLDNYENVVQACMIMIDSNYFNLAKRRVTVSTSGLIPEIRQLAHDLPVSLAISLHTTDDEERSDMMPINRKYPLPELKQALLDYQEISGNDITFEYVMIEGKNDSIPHAKKLIKYLHGLRAKLNLIPLNHFPGSEMEASNREKLESFQQYLHQRSYPAPVRYSRAQDISGACGQLAAKREHEINLPPQTVAKTRRQERKAGKL